MGARSHLHFAFVVMLALWTSSAGYAGEADSAKSPGPPSTVEADYYRIVSLPIPREIVLEVGAIDQLPDGRLVLCTRRGDVYFVENPLADPPQDVAFRLFASGLHEPLGVVWRDGALYVTQRGELTRLRDVDGDGRADAFETVADGWGLTDNYHEYAFGSPVDRDGNFWIALCLTGSFTSEAKFRGWALRITPDGKLIPTASGIRSPGGIGINAAGDVFYTDNQGPWNGACALRHLAIGSFQGNPSGNGWYADAPEMGPAPEEPKSGSRWAAESDRMPQLLPPAVWLPYAKMGQSASGIAPEPGDGRFGPFAGQMFVGDQSHSTVMRVDLETIDGRYQGACFPFREGLGSGTLALKFLSDGSLAVGGTSRGWSSKGPQPYSLERLVWTGKTPFEVATMRARPDGFELSFTAAVDPAAAGDPASYSMSAYTYIYQSTYGSPEVDKTTPMIREARVSGDRKRVHLLIDGLVRGHVHELHLDGVRSAEHAPLLHREAYYTLNRLPK